MPLSLKQAQASLLLSALLLSVVPTARGQQSVDLIMDNFTSSVLSQTTTLINNNMVMEAARRNGGTSKTGKRTSAATAASSAAYVPTTAVRRQVVKARALNMQATNPAAMQQFPAMFGPGGASDYAPLYRQLIQGSGLRENNVADAFAAYVVGSYQVARGEVPGGPLLPAAPVRGARAQFQPAVARALAGRPVGTVAELGEFLKLQTVLLSIGAKQTNPTFQRNVAATLQRRFKLDIATLKLTDQGFARK